MPYRYLDHEADIGLEATGATLEEALESGVQGVLDLMVDTRTVEPREAVLVAAKADEQATLFVALLNAVLAQRDVAGYFFRRFQLDSIGRSGGRWEAQGLLWGEPVDLRRHEVGTEVKAATYSGLRAETRPGNVTLRCVLDV